MPLHNGPAGISLDDPISQVESGHISASVTCALLLRICSTLQSEIWAEVSAKADGGYLQAVLNSPAPLDGVEPRHEVSKPNLREEFDEKPGNKAESEDNPENLPENKEVDLSHLIEPKSQAFEEFEDAELIILSQVVAPSAFTLSRNLSGARGKKFGDSSEFLSQ